MKKRSMLAIASLAAGVVTALVTPAPPASAAENPLGGATGLLQEDQGVETVTETVETVQGAGSALQPPRAGGLL
ncbi:secreted protein [Streptomyces venezuelae]|uniref:hypothetical protein n=1 Tax=Streptomyces gardneri TaxID=66892 RepID=UPI0006BD1AAA|nr:hypothetical protein [Streptomyces gardneri]ALO13169.1 secreted protein [Streptomyces venezuelae]WRK41400.1 hypothetical protein U0M97_38270 [Streptomyces venezuelae]CUM36153.1 hypothetical protein BN2537_1271 [Streptomyces venezuelae]